MNRRESERVGGAGTAETSAPQGGQRVGVVLSGAAGRGPYQAGALAELLPALEANRHRPVVLLGTSSGAITAALYAQSAHQPPAVAGQSVINAWVNFGDVFRNPLCNFKLARLLARLLPRPTQWLLARLGAGGLVAPVDALLDTTPLHQRASNLFQPRMVANNIRNGLIDSLAVAATVCPEAGSAARSRLFVQGKPPGRAPRSRTVDVVPVSLTVDHLLASAAIPGLFPPVYLNNPPPSAGYYIDGGVRLNAPFDTALAMDIDRLVVISGHSLSPSTISPAGPGAPPDLAATTAIALRAVLTDALSDDLDALRRNNANAKASRAARRRSPYKEVPHLVVAPQDGELAMVAASTFRPRVPMDPYWAIGLLLDTLGMGSGRNELLSLIFFNREYARELVARGRKHAKDALGKGWQT
jgi:NTE family protein